MVEHPAYGALREVTPFASVVLENNPNMMTLEGTNSWVLRAPGATGCVVVDPGEDDAAHRDVLAAVGPVDLVLITHRHHDHVGGAAAFATAVDAPVRAFDPSLCRDAQPLTDGEVLTAAGLAVQVLHTPGHTDDSVSLLVQHENNVAVLTGDTILGRGTTVLSDLGDYLCSLCVLTEMPAGATGLPGHGPELADVGVTATQYLKHREQRLDQVRAALDDLGEDATPRQVVEKVYADVDQSLWGPAEHSVRAQLDYLRAR